MNVTTITCKSALNKIESGFPYPWDCNAYRGCSHGCRYCFAIYSHKYMEDSNYFQNIFVKTNIAERLEEKLASKSWKGEIINLGGVTDSYQPLEKTYRLMPDILSVLIKYKNPCIISTKSDLILRDYDLIETLASLTYVNIAFTVTTTDEELRKKLEPNASPSAKRFDALYAFSKTNASTALHSMPLIPYLTDDEKNIRRLFEMAKYCKVRYVLCDLLNLRGDTKIQFLNFIREEYPHLYPSFLKLYPKSYPNAAYATAFHQKAKRLREEYGLSGDYRKPIQEKMQPYTQLRLF